MSFLNLENVAANTKAELPVGTYRMKVESAEVKPTKTGGKYILMWLVVTDEGSNKGRKLSHMFNIENSSAKAQQIGLSELKTFLLCAGEDGKALESVSALVGKEATVKTKMEKDREGNERAKIGYFVGNKKTLSSAAPITQPRTGF